MTSKTKIHAALNKASSAATDARYVERAMSDVVADLAKAQRAWDEAMGSGSEHAIAAKVAHGQYASKIAVESARELSKKAAKLLASAIAAERAGRSA